MKRPGNEPIQPVDNGRRRRLEWHKVNNVLEEWFWLGLFHGEIKGVVYGVSVSSKEGLNTCEGKKLSLNVNLSARRIILVKHVLSIILKSRRKFSRNMIFTVNIQVHSKRFMITSFD